MKVISHTIDPQRGVEEMVVEGAYGRKAHFQCGIFDGTDADAFFASQQADFEAQETALTATMARFNPETLERK